MSCKVPPPGWYCTRDEGHEGPCAAMPYDRKLTPDEGIRIGFKPCWADTGNSGRCRLPVNHNGECIGVKYVH